jgi:hypothetical protein
MMNETTRKQDMNMKTNGIPAMFRPLCLAVAAIAVLTLASAANAQYKPVGDDGIAASPKVTQMLKERGASARTVIAATHAMPCPRCTDVTTTELNRQAKGAEILTGAATRVVARHACEACDTKLRVVGEGKAKHTTATHTCTANVANNVDCCAAN